MIFVNPVVKCCVVSQFWQVFVWMSTKLEDFLNVYMQYVILEMKF